MGVAYYIQLDNDDPGFDPFVNGKAVARARKAIDRITEKLGLPGIDDLTSYAEWDEEFDLPDEMADSEVPWFDADVGLRWASTLRAYIESNQDAVPVVKEPDRVVADLRQYEDVFEKAKAIEAKWHFALDM